MADLIISPRIVGRAGAALERIGNRIDRINLRNARTTAAVTRTVTGLRIAYRGAAVAAEAGATATQRIVRTVFSLKSAVAGLIATGGGLTLLDATIGSADRIETQRRLLQAVLRDSSEVAKAQRLSVRLANEVASLTRGQAVTGLVSTLRLTNGDVDRAGELVRIAQALTQTVEGQTFEDALFSLSELASGDVVSLRSRFGIRIPTRSEAERIAKRDGKTIQDVMLEALQSDIDRRFGGGVRGAGITTLISIDTNSVRGQLGQFVTAFQDTLAEVGEASRATLAQRLPQLLTRFRDLTNSPRFREGVERVSNILLDWTDRALTFANRLPKVRDRIIELGQSIRAFVEENRRALSFGAAIVAEQALTGGILRRAAIGAGAAGARAIGGRLLGRLGGGGGAAASLSGIPNGVTPVWVVNSGAGGVAGAIGSAAGGGASTSAALRAALGIGGGALAAGATIFGSYALGAITLADALQTTTQASRALAEEQEQERQRISAARLLRAVEVQKQDALITDQNRSSRRFVEGLNTAMQQLFVSGRLGLPNAGANRAAGAANIRALLGGADTRFTQTNADDELLAINRALATQGLRFEVGEKQLISEGRFAPVDELFAREAAVAERAAALNGRVSKDPELQQQLTDIARKVDRTTALASDLNRFQGRPTIGSVEVNFVNADVARNDPSEFARQFVGALEEEFQRHDLANGE